MNSHTVELVSAIIAESEDGFDRAEFILREAKEIQQHQVQTNIVTLKDILRENFTPEGIVRIASELQSNSNTEVKFLHDTLVELVGGSTMFNQILKEIEG